MIAIRDRAGWGGPSTSLELGGVKGGAGLLAFNDRPSGWLPRSI